MVIPSFPSVWACPTLPLPGPGASVAVGLRVEPAWSHAAPLSMAPSRLAKWGNAPADVTAPYTHPKDYGVNLFTFSTVPSPGTCP